MSSFLAYVGDTTIGVNVCGADLTRPYVDVRKYADFASAVSAIGAAEDTLLIPDQQAVTGDVTVPATLQLKFLRGGSLNISNTKTVTINGHVDAGLYQIFEGAGSVSFGSGAVKEIYPEWWGAKGDGVTDNVTAIQAAIDSTTSSCEHLVFSAGDYRISAELTLDHTFPIHILGSGIHGTYIVLTSVSQNGFNITMDRPVIMDGFTLTSIVTKSAGAGIVVAGKTGSTWNSLSKFRNLIVSAQYVGIDFIDASLFWVKDCYFYLNNNIGVQIRNSVASDTGDGTIINCAFNSPVATSAAINYKSGGGLRLINNKFWNHNCAFLMNLTDGNTGGLTIIGNSFDSQTNYEISLSHTGAYTFYGVLISGNFFAGSGTLDIGQTGTDWLYELTITDNYFAAGVVRGHIELGGVIGGVISNNSFYGQNGASVGITLGSDCTNILVPSTNKYTRITTPIINNGTNLIHPIIQTSGTIAPTVGTWGIGSICWNTVPAAGGVPGWVCVHSGTFGAATDNTGDTDGATAVITGMTDTSDFLVGDYVDVSAGFPTTGPYKVLALTATTMTIEVNSDAAQANITVDTSDPTWKAMANLAA